MRAGGESRWIDIRDSFTVNLHLQTPRMFMRYSSFSSSHVAFGFLLSFAVACASAPAPASRVAEAGAAITDENGAPRGSAQMWQDANSVVHVDVQLRDLPAGTHGIHFHAVGRCDGRGSTAFASAGTHYNPLGRQHGMDNPRGPHAGDAPNFTIDADGVGRARFTTDRVSLTSGSTSLFDADGSSIVVHSTADDQISQPAGNSGARIACGVVRRG